MKKGRHYKTLCLTLAVGTLAFGSMAQAATTTKNLKAIYNGIKVVYNGTTQTIASDMQPFIANDRTYVPVRAIAEILGCDVDFINNTVVVSGNGVNANDFNRQIAAKNLEIAGLKQQLDLVNKELAVYKGTGSSGSANLNTDAIRATLNKLQDTYGDDFDVDWDIELRSVSNRLELTVSYNARYDERDFNGISDNKLKSFIKDMCYDIAQRHADVEIRGTIEESNKDIEKASFRYSKSGSYSFDRVETADLDELQKDLEKDYTRINYIGSLSLKISRIELKEDSKGDTLIFKVVVNLKEDGTDNTKKWNSELSADAKYQLEKYLFEAIKKDIEHDFSQYDTIEGYIYDSYTGKNIADYANGKTYLKDAN